ncbi:MAG: NAD-dependent epimerase/dehydratase family protein [Bradymonadaceae bacterium]|nr:NAD-dependent epimerase/dehydratase family protein [Lujinxingiaceae bacterium]
MTTLVTGATGFLGRHLVDQLLARGEHVRALTRSFDLELADLGVEIVEGDFTDPEALERAVDGVSHVYHLAGKVERDPSHAHRMYSLHVDGTRHLLAALRTQKLEKIVVASTSGTVGVGTSPNFMATDDSPTVELLVKSWPYYLSKIYAERVCQDAIDDHAMPIVMMRPTLLLGPGDRRESSTGDVVLFMQKKIPSSMSGGISFVDARDTAQAFILAMDKAPVGAKYLLGACNLTLADFFKRLEELSGVKAPWLPIPDRAALFGTKLLDAAFRSVGKRPDLDPVSVDMARHFWYIDSTRAQDELGWTPRNANETLRDTVRWIERHHPEFAPRNVRKLPPAGFVPQETLDYAAKNRAE